MSPATVQVSVARFGPGRPAELLVGHHHAVGLKAVALEEVEPGQDVREVLAVARPERRLHPREHALEAEDAVLSPPVPLAKNGHLDAVVADWQAVAHGGPLVCWFGRT